jgi:ribosome biogenesis GTPase A
MVLVDTPGILWPRLSPPECGYRLALTGAIKDNQFDYLELAMFTADFMRRRYPQALMKRYKLPEMPDGPVENVLNAIAARRGCLGKGGVPDLHRVSELLIHEYRQGLFGLVSLELPEDIAREAPAPRSDQ